MKSEFRIIAAILALLCVLSFMSACSENKVSVTRPRPDTSENSERDPVIAVPEESYTEPTYTEATVLSAGDIMFHMSQVNTAYNSATDEYDFNDVFTYVKPLVSAADLAVVNYETTLAGSAPYTGFPGFNSPESSLDAIKKTGFDMVLYANNHSYDGYYREYSKSGALSILQRTASRIEDFGMKCLGARSDTSKSTYGITEVKGIKFGFLNYADDLGSSSTNRTINGISMSNDALDYIDLFTSSMLSQFYTEVGNRIGEMRENGADVIVFYVHWGVEYRKTATNAQREIASHLCDLGVDIIIGSHPHVVENCELLTSTDGSHSTICFYSLGNYVSNQCRDTLSSAYCSGNNKETENGLMVRFTVRKYETGECSVTSVETIPTWVHRYKCADGFYDYRIIPLTAEVLASPGEYGLDSTPTGAERAAAALAMTNDTLGSSVPTTLVLSEGKKV